MPDIKPAKNQQKVCLDCGCVVSDDCRYCGPCGRRQAGKRIAEAAVKGRLAAKTPEAEALKSAKMIAHRDAIENWNPAELPGWLDENVYIAKIQPALKDIRKRTIADALGISIGVAYKFAKGTRIPHKRHWAKLAELVGVSHRG